MYKLFNKVSFATSKIVTQEYSTSFSIGVRCLAPSIRDAIYSVYGFVRFADEIVDTFHEYDKEHLLNCYESCYYQAIKDGISLNPILHSFQCTVKRYNIDDHLIQSFLKSMRSDLHNEKLDNNEIDEYIYGSAEVVGLMCLKVFVKGNETLYEELKPYAKRLGAAFQKINFLRDIQHDTQNLSRTYFPILKEEELNERTKQILLDDILADYEQAMIGIKKLPKEAYLGVYTAYLYYKKLTNKIQHTKAEELMSKRISVSNSTKMLLLCKAYLTSKLN
ncbi:MAG: hypothetical protein RL662_2343 [Bacteroidota bacterium]|jgi:phytoene/squalene synthetase